MALDLESSRHFPSAVALENTRIGGRHTECACYFVDKTSGIGIAPAAHTMTRWPRDLRFLFFELRGAAEKRSFSGPLQLLCDR